MCQAPYIQGREDTVVNKTYMVLPSDSYKGMMSVTYSLLQEHVQRTSNLGSGIP